MDFGNLPFMTTTWSSVPVTEHPGAPGTARWRTVQAGSARIRMVEYSPGYVADHWCRRGHVLLVLEGTLVTEGTQTSFTKGARFVISTMLQYTAAPFGA